MGASFSSDTALVKALLSMGADPALTTDAGFTPLMQAAYKGSSEIVTLLLPKSDVDAKTSAGFTTLMQAVYSGNAACVRALLTAGADIAVPDAKGHTALWWALKQKKPDIAALLRQAGAHRTHRSARRPCCPVIELKRNDGIS